MPPNNADIRPDLTLADALEMQFRFVALDVETANGDPASICQIGLACVRADATIVTLGFLVKPNGEFEDFNSRLHGIDAQSVRDADMFPQIVEPLRPLLERQPLVQHSGFDKRAMNGACAQFGLDLLNSIWHDSVTIARRAWPELRGNGGHGLGNLKTVLDLDFQHHDATEDARAAAQVVLLAEAAMGIRFDQVLARPTSARARTSNPVNYIGRPDGPHFGLVACITGKLSQPRAKLAARATEAGITISSRMSPEVTMLVISDRGQELDLRDARGKSSKQKQAEALIAQGVNIRILGESAFLALIDG